jgi:hypothetical protein
MELYKDKVLTFVYDYIFPGFCLPNALNPQIGIVNYIMSQYQDEIKYGSYTENDGLFSKITSNSLGGIQNTLTGFLFEAEVYRKSITYENEPLYTTIKRDKKFIYPINPAPNFINFCGKENQSSNGNKIKGDYFWKFMSKIALIQIKRGNGFIFIDYSMEPFMTMEHHKMLTETLKDSGIDKDSIYVAVNSFNAKELYEKQFDKGQRFYNVVNTPFCIEYGSYYYNDVINKGLDVVLTLDKFLETKNVIRQNHFLMKIKAPKKHRIKIMSLLIDDDLISLGDWSFTYEEGIKFSNSDRFKKATKDLNLKNVEKVSNFLDNGPFNLQSEQNLTFHSINAWTDKQYTPYVNSYFEICFESFFYMNDGTLSLTEKIFKAIINFQPFIFFTTNGTLKLMRDLGFKTFRGYIDESYDDIVHNEKRLIIAYEEIKKLCNMTKEEIHNWYWSMEEILIHNHNHLLSICHNKMLSEDVFNKFYELTKQ